MDILKRLAKMTHTQAKAFYLASPYSHPLKAKMRERYLQTEDALHLLLGHEIWTYSPIVHCHNMAERLELPRDAKFWQRYNETMLASSCGMIVLQLQDWEHSLGVAMEMNLASKFPLPIFFLRNGLITEHRQ